MVGSVHVFTGVQGKSPERLHKGPAKTSRLLDIMRTPQSPRGQFACHELGCRSVEGATLRFPSPCWRWHSLGPAAWCSHAQPGGRTGVGVLSPTEGLGGKAAVSSAWSHLQQRCPVSQ